MKGGNNMFSLNSNPANTMAFKGRPMVNKHINFERFLNGNPHLSEHINNTFIHTSQNVCQKGKSSGGFWLGLPSALKDKMLQSGPTESTKRIGRQQQALSTLLDLPTRIKSFFKNLF